jgi:hypothetical protein
MIRRAGGTLLFIALFDIPAGNHLKELLYARDIQPLVVNHLPNTANPAQVIVGEESLVPPTPWPSQPVVLIEA